MKYNNLNEMLYDDFCRAWAEIGVVYAWHEGYRRLGFEVSFDEHGTVVRRPLATCYMDSL